MAKSNKVVTIDITNESITVLEVTGSPKNTVVHNAAIFETPEDAFEDGQIKNREAIAAALKQGMAANHITNKNATFVLNSTKVVNREVLIPEVPDKKIAGIVKANAPEYFPVNIEDYVVSHSVLEHTTGEDGTKQLRLLVVAAPSFMVKQYYELAAACGLQVNAIDYIGNAMLQLIKTQTSANTTTMVVQLGSESTVLNIVRGDTLLLQRTVPYGTNAVVQEVMDERGVDATTAMTLLQNERLLTVEFDDNAVTGALRYLVNNIGRVMDYYASKNPDMPIEECYLSGDGALMKGIDGLFKIQLNINTKIMDTLVYVSFDSKIDMKVYNPVYLIVPIGAALNPMNFLPPEIAEKAASKGALTGYIVGMIALILVAIALAGVSILKLTAANAQKLLLNVQIAEIQDIETIIANYESAKAQYADAATMYSYTKDKNEQLSQLITELEAAIPEETYCTEFEANSDGVSITAVSATYPEIAKFIMELKNISCVNNVFVGEITENVDQDTNEITYTYDVTCLYNELAPEQVNDFVTGESTDITIDVEE